MVITSEYTLVMIIMSALKIDVLFEHIHCSMIIRGDAWIETFIRHTINSINILGIYVRPTCIIMIRCTCRLSIIYKPYNVIVNKHEIPRFVIR
jgi:hypothetical protein